MPDPFLFVLFGATGDLSHRKVVPALYQLWRTNLLPHEFDAHLHRPPARTTTTTFRAEMRAALDKYSPRAAVEPEVWESSPSGSSITAAISTIRGVRRACRRG